MKSQLLACGFALGLSALLAGAVAAAPAGITTPAAPEKWSFNATIIEACSCPMFCQCYFSTEPAAHMDAMPGMKMEGQESQGAGAHYCKFNNAFRINKGMYGKVDLAGARFWVAGDLGGDFSKGQMDWAVLTFDPAVSKDQRDGISAILGHVYPVKWNSFSVAADAPMTWTATRDHAEAKLDGGKTAEVVLNKNQGMTADPIVIRNLKYWGVPRNDGFVLMQNAVEAYHAGDKPYEFKGTNGFMITLDMTSKDFAPQTR